MEKECYLTFNMLPLELRIIIAHYAPLCQIQSCSNIHNTVCSYCSFCVCVLHKWHLVKCHNGCGDYLCNSCGSTCASCKLQSCVDCTGFCKHCRNDVCQDCQNTCDNCDSIQCTSCIVNHGACDCL